MLVLSNAAIAALLLVAASAKLVSPDQLLLALRELSDHLAPHVTQAHVRGYGVLEIVAGVLLLPSPTRLIGAALVAVLGTSFAVVGILGSRRSSRIACGCFGNLRGRPLGQVNVILGSVFIAVGVANIALPQSPSDGLTFSQIAFLGSALDALLLCAWFNRSLISLLFLPLRSLRRAI